MSTHTHFRSHADIPWLPHCSAHSPSPSVHLELVTEQGALDLPHMLGLAGSWLAGRGVLSSPHSAGSARSWLAGGGALGSPHSAGRTVSCSQAGVCWAVHTWQVALDRVDTRRLLLAGEGVQGHTHRLGHSVPQSHTWQVAQGRPHGLGHAVCVDTRRLVLAGRGVQDTSLDGSHRLCTRLYARWVVNAGRRVLDCPHVAGRTGCHKQDELQGVMHASQVGRVVHVKHTVQAHACRFG
jgi:hypothetical protein